MRLLIAILLLGFLLPGAGGSAAAVDVAPPNVVLILADDLGYGDLGVYGNNLIKTPHLDRLAGEGVRLTSFYASASLCTPSRAGLLTGRYAIRDGLAEGTITVDDTRGLPADAITIADMLRQRGYRTALVGKWHLGHHLPEQRPNAHGFDFFYGLLQPNDAAGVALYRNAEPVGEPLEQSALTRLFTEQAREFMESKEGGAGRPFFLFLSHSAPHIPLVPSSEFAASSQAGAYGDVVQELDWSVGKVLEALERIGAAANTLIIFTSDNGPFPEGSTGGLRGGKGSAWEGGHRVPLIARWPGHIPSGATSDGMAMNIDLLPTLQAITGAALPAGRKIDGRNITGLLKGSANSPHEALYYFSNERIAAVRTENWKMLIEARYLGIVRRLPEHGVSLLFDMRQDPTERYSMAAHRPDKWRELQAHLKRGQRELGAPP